MEIIEDSYNENVIKSQSIIEEYEDDQIQNIRKSEINKKAVNLYKEEVRKKS